MLKLLRDTGGLYIAIICDHCEQRITDRRDGTGVYAEESNGVIVNEGLYFVHDECFSSFTNHPRWDGGSWYVLPLTIIPALLGLNIGMTPDLSAASLAYWQRKGYLIKREV